MAIVPVSFYPNKRKMVGNWTYTVLKKKGEKRVCEEK